MKRRKDDVSYTNVWAKFAEHIVAQILYLTTYYTYIISSLLYGTREHRKLDLKLPLRVGIISGTERNGGTERLRLVPDFRRI